MAFDTLRELVPGVSEAALGRLRTIRKALEAADVREKMNSAALIRRDHENYTRVVKDVGIRLD